MSETVVVTDSGFKNLDTERALIEKSGRRLVVAQCKTPTEVIQAAANADALLVQWAPITAEVIASLTRCQVIVRYGIGVDNIDLASAKARGIPVCNVPDYGIDEVADHAMALALAAARQLRPIEDRIRQGTWKITPVGLMPAFRDMTFATAGFGRIARAVLERARGFRFKLAAYDPYVPASVFQELGVAQLSRQGLFTESDIVSLHLPVTPDTRHMVNAQTLGEMKKTAILVNTARGPLVDLAALAAALHEGRIAAAGLDVFETEPLPAGNPILGAPNALLTSHTAWYSEKSVPTLQRKAAEEVIRALDRQPLLNRLP
jgi:D-3-phosphoglycerate dehydrogenase